MNYYSYILKSCSTGKLYKGHTHDLLRRLGEHNSSDKDLKKYTHKDPGPWELIYSEEFSTRSEAMIREKFYKSGKGREYIKEQLSR